MPVLVFFAFIVKTLFSPFAGAGEAGVGFFRLPAALAAVFLLKPPVSSAAGSFGASPFERFFLALLLPLLLSTAVPAWSAGSTILSVALPESVPSALPDLFTEGASAAAASDEPAMLESRAAAESAAAAAGILGAAGAEAHAGAAAAAGAGGAAPTSSSASAAGSINDVAWRSWVCTTQHIKRVPQRGYV